MQKKENAALSGRVPGEPHPDWEMKKGLFDGLFDKEKIDKIFQTQGIMIRLVCLNPHDPEQFRIYTHAEFSWHKNDKVYAYPLSFHINISEFKERLREIYEK